MCIVPLCKDFFHRASHCGRQHPNGRGRAHIVKCASAETIRSHPHIPQLIAAIGGFEPPIAFGSKSDWLASNQMPAVLRAGPDAGLLGCDHVDHRKHSRPPSKRYSSNNLHEGSSNDEHRDANL
jgi:hypothetical protein